ncbi:hypothetical protein BIV57_04345 [Mangrovactinospora gilvigrisea]|uniref:HTH cro/C1-type domain-containing protein n=1 Tax=Mangrovactinospora gilvigrisea TaxID=1428644 RepID=A0A1J7CB26_9ACTN|nr:helix-turn-helix transcriptional regulator [Mangrovactinospora gilvigrisea]OIV38720.1 hypothetical protein BIV57_04345 [Mangrovactinospora gilvigrisea]
MMEQPAFGRRLKQLRTERGLTQNQLAGEGMSTGYLSRLESGTRRPTEQAAAHLADRLGVTPADLAAPPARPLEETLAIATGLPTEQAGELLARALRADTGNNPLTRWQALWHVASWRQGTGERAEQRAAETELVALADEVDVAELRVRARARLTRTLRSAGEVSDAVETASAAHRLAATEGLASDLKVQALLALAPALLEAGRRPEARARVEELLDLVEGGSDATWARAVWTAASVINLQGERQAALDLLAPALERFEGRLEPPLWAGLRMFAAGVHLWAAPPHQIEPAERLIDEVEAAKPFVSTPTIELDLRVLRARLAVLTRRVDEARDLLQALRPDLEQLTYRDQARMELLRHQLLLLDGRQEEGMRGLRALARQAEGSGNMNLAAEIWREAAEALTTT